MQYTETRAVEDLQRTVWRGKPVVDKQAVVLAMRSTPKRTLKSVGDEFGISREWVRKILKDADSSNARPLRGPSKRLLKYEAIEERRAARRRMHAAAFALRQRGMTFREIGDALGVDLSTAHEWVLKARAAGITVQA